MYSILNQDYQNREIVVIDDHSSDNTYRILSDLKKENNFILLRNYERVGSPLANFIKGIEIVSLGDEDILVTVDGDDKLYDNNVLSYLNEVYQDEEIYMTYGQYVPTSKTYSNLCAPIADTRSYRKSGMWVASHLRTVKRKLFEKIDKNDLKDSNGDYYKMAGDAAYLYPIIEMSGQKHMKFINTILYIYNDQNPGNEMKVNEQQQLNTAEEIRNKRIYDEL